ncbi:MAG: GntR family transcriptional regulator [Chloroflexi bacterium]|nr:GntR family transcriptional regulator [Chloroflexota bacterium]MBU1752205.1 GntR family transcriptional regulator [Chloroflexota bacterium]MBU1877401.1 GntR family transcriptional regulator [Chloroflexota bacterium]
MDSTPLYQQIAEAIRQEVLRGSLNPGDQLPTVRKMAARWACTPGTVQRAYKALAGQGIVDSRPGQGTRVVGAVPAAAGIPLRRATLVHQAEAFFLETLAAGYDLDEVEQAIGLALDRWRALAQEPALSAGSALRFAGSHDPAVSLIAAQFPRIAGCDLQVAYAGSLGGLMTLALGDADMAGCHLWDAESDSYNAPFVQRLLPGRRVALLTLAHRRLGLIVPPGNPAGLTDLPDLARPGQRFVNRQRGAGTRVWLDAQLHRRALDPARIAGYDDEQRTHSQVAQAVAEGRADVGLGVQAAALAYGLDFVLLTTERYDLVIPAEAWESPGVRALACWLATAEARNAIADLGGYDTHDTGRVSWLD